MRSLKDLLEKAKAKPGSMTYTTSGPGSAQHLMGEQLKRSAAVDLTPVHYKGESHALIDLMGGQVDVGIIFPLSSIPHIRSGKLRPLAVTASKRIGPLPSTPTVAEVCCTEYDETIWMGYAVPKGTSQVVLDKLFQAFHSSVTSAEYRARLDERGGELIATNPMESAALVKADYERYRKLVSELSLRNE
jgi:tripartite-type tricarboxylate transporter receptor subunit TctC